MSINRKTTWRIELAKAMGGNDDRLIYTTLTEEEYDKLFDPGYGGAEGPEFTAWGEKYVYFPCVYDGSEWVGYAPVWASDEKTTHQGGG
jgi:hypothetical protein